MTDPLPANLRSELEALATNAHSGLGEWARIWLDMYPKPRFTEHAETLRSIANGLASYSNVDTEAVNNLRRIAADLAGDNDA